MGVFLLLGGGWEVRWNLWFFFKGDCDCFYRGWWVEMEFLVKGAHVGGETYRQGDGRREGRLPYSTLIMDADVLYKELLE